MRWVTLSGLRPLSRGGVEATQAGGSGGAVRAAKPLAQSSSSCDVTSAWRLSTRYADRETEHSPCPMWTQVGRGAEKVFGLVSYNLVVGSTDLDARERPTVVRREVDVTRERKSQSDVT